jgi:hypothetical protein
MSQPKPDRKFPLAAEAPRPIPPAAAVHIAASSFSKASHFGALLTPVAIGVALCVLQDPTHSILYRMGIISLLVGSLAMGVGVLHSVSRFDSDES